ncbi:MAG: hypothetical protein LUC86_06780 [Prevotellaceae bacterium]|nr:hypothetical protein [Prevotellaceae bacterium]
MTEQELLKHCRYYKWEEDCPWHNAKGETDPETGKPVSLLGLIHFFWGKGGASYDLDLFEKFIREQYL